MTYKEDAFLWVRPLQFSVVTVLCDHSWDITAAGVYCIPRAALPSRGCQTSNIDQTPTLQPSGTPPPL